MAKCVKQTLTGYRIPDYLAEILTSGKCSGFLSMSILREGDIYVLSYDTTYYDRLNFNCLTTLDKLKVVYEVFIISSDCDDRLVRAELYMLDPALVYRRRGDSSAAHTKLMYYPDRTAAPFNVKISSFINKVIDRGNSGEAEVFDRILNELQSGELWRAERRLSRAIEMYNKGSR